MTLLKCGSSEDWQVSCIREETNNTNTEALKQLSMKMALLNEIYKRKTVLCSQQITMQHKTVIDIIVWGQKI